MLYAEVSYMAFGFIHEKKLWFFYGFGFPYRALQVTILKKEKPCER